MTDKREQNRKSFPEIAAIMDDVKKFFPSAKLLHGHEGGREIGREPEWMKRVDAQIVGAYNPLSHSPPSAARLTSLTRPALPQAPL